MSIFNDALVGIAERYLKKGSKVYLEGQLETRKYTDKDGVEKYSTEVVLRPYRGELTLLDGRSGGAGDSMGGSDMDSGFGGGNGGGFGGGQSSGGSRNDMDDEIPF